MKKYCSIKITKQSSAEQNPQSKVISITRVQVKELLVASQQIVSCKPKSWELGVYHIVIQRVMSLSHCELLAKKLVSCNPASL